MYDEIIQLFEIPCEAQEFIPFYLTGKEMDAIAVMKREAYLPSELEVLLKPIAGNPANLIQEAYSRGVFNKVEREGVIYYQAANFYRRIAYFAQYEPEAWVSIPEENRKQIDAWYVKEYAQGAIPRLKLSQQDPTQLIENAFFYTLQETLDLIDRQEQEEFCLVPCNCKAVSLGCADTKPQTVCLGIHFREINSDWDRGHGTLIHKEEAKKLVRLANQKGLMQTTETKWGICNCCGCCCYPIRASEQIGAKGSWPKQVYEVIWAQDLCKHCGKCARICNFGAFSKQDGKVLFDREKCWGCTICANHCAFGAISLRPIFDPSSAQKIKCDKEASPC